jgi:HSP20 family protein
MLRQITETAFTELLPPVQPRQRGRRVETVANNKFAVDVTEDEKHIYIYAELPGIAKDKVQLDILNNHITITAEKPTFSGPEEVKLSGDILYGQLERKIKLPLCVTRQETVAARMENGILRICISKFLEEENRFSVNVA